MGKTDDLDLISGFSDLSTRVKGTDPRQLFPTQVLNQETTSPYGILAKGIAGAMLSRNAGAEMDQIRQLQAVRQQQAQEVSNILSEHEKQGLSNAHTKKTLRELMLKTGNPFAKQFLDGKLADLDEDDPIDQFNDYLKLRKGMSRKDFEKDPTYMHLKAQADKAFSKKYGTGNSIAQSSTQASPTAGARQDTNQDVNDVNGFDDLAKKAVAPERDPFTGKLTDKGEQQNIENKLALEKEKKKVKGLTGDIGGRVTLSREALRNIPSLKTVLYPDGTPQSFNQELANKLTVGKFPKDKDAQNAYRWLGRMLVGRQLIETGVAARPEETKRLIKEFGVNFLTDPEAALQGLSELETFYKDFVGSVDPSGNYPELSSGGNRKVVRRGRSGNKTVVQYSDGTVEYAA